VPAGGAADLEAKVKALEPQLVRVFFHEIQEKQSPDRMASFIETVELAQQAGATINITYHTAANAKLQPAAYMAEFAGVLEDLVRTRGYTNVRWVTIQNEPDSTLVTLEQYNALYRALHAELVARGLRGHIGLMGGDLVESSNVPEFGVRGILNVSGKPPIQPGYWQDGTPMARTNVAVFQQLWFKLVSAQLGFTGAVKWDANWGKYKPGYNDAALPDLSRSPPAPADDPAGLAGARCGPLGGRRLEGRRRRPARAGDHGLRKPGR
jgi:hypothetical protein